MIKNKKSTKMTALILALVLITSCFVGGTLARYITSTSSEDSARVAVWGINADDVEMDLFDGSYTVNGVLVAVSEDDDNIIAPGTKKDNYFSIVNLDENLKPEVMYEVAINLDDSEIDQRILDNPSIQWRLDEGNYGTWEETKAQILALSGDASGVKTYAPLEIAENFKAGKTHKIGWQWIMDNNNNVMDTEMGNAATRGDITAKISVKVTARQVQEDTTGTVTSGLTYNKQNPKELTFRSSEPLAELQEVKIDGEVLTRDLEYFATDGSTIIKVTLDGLYDLEVGNHTISIISENATVEDTFTVIDEIIGTPSTNPIIHNDVIPEGAVYYSNVTNLDIEFPDEPPTIYAFDERTIDFEAKYETGDEFPTLRTGDIYIYDDIVYRYNMEFDPNSFISSSNSWIENTTLNGWGARSNSPYKTYAYNMLSTINEADLISLKGAFEATLIQSVTIPNTVKSLESAFEAALRLETPPTIPNSVTNMNFAFERAIRLTTAPVIPENVTQIMYTLKNTPITGTVEINATNLTNFIEDEVAKWIFGLSDPENPLILTGTSPYLEEIAALYTNVTVQR